MKGLIVPIVFILLLIVFEYYTFQALKLLFKKKYISYIILGLNVLFYALIVYLVATAGRKSFGTPKFNFLVTAIFITLIPKLFLIIPLLLEDFARLIQYIFQNKKETRFYPSRRKAISLIALGLASIPFLSILYGVVKGKFNYKVKTVKLNIPNLPKAFKGFKIVQISDIHSGSFNESHISELQKGIDLINQQNADLVLFTGDLVNSVADEIVPFKKTFGGIQAKIGKYSVLGNHDYGDYAYGKDEEKNIKNRLGVDKHLADMGFTQLRNQHVKIEKEGESINLIGVENFGADHYFPKTGDLDLATEGIKVDAINILMSHDPSHFDHDLPQYTNVINYPKPIHLTLSGHTHGMQFGIEIPGIIKWSPVKYRYKNWAGLYQEKGKYLYVNRGYGVLGFPGRVGIWPEITVLELT